MNDGLGRILRILAIVFMGLTAAMNILGGVGTVCAAFLTRNYPPMWPLLDYQWLYQGLMILTILIGIAGVWLTVRLARGTAGSYRSSLILLLLGTAFAAIQVGASMALRGRAVPANMKLYANVVTLLIFLVIRLPGIRQRVDLDSSQRGQGTGMASGLAATLAGILILTTSLWVGPSHTFEGNNWVHVLRTPLLAAGSLLILAGGARMVTRLFERHRLLATSAAPEMEKAL